MHIDSNFQNVMWPRCYELCKMSSLTIHWAIAMYSNLWCKIREGICWLAYHTSLLRKLIHCFSLLWKLFMQIHILSYWIHKSAEAWVNICKKRSVWFSQGKYKFLLTTHYSMPSSMRCGVMMCNGIVFVNFVNQCLLNTSNFLHHTWSHYHDILVTAYCVCSLNEKYAILAYMKSLINLLFTICIKNCYVSRYIYTYI